MAKKNKKIKLASSTLDTDSPSFKDLNIYAVDLRKADGEYVDNTEHVIAHSVVDAAKIFKGQNKYVVECVRKMGSGEHIHFSLAAMRIIALEWEKHNTSLSANPETVETAAKA